MVAKHIPGLSSVKLDISVESVARYFGGNGYIGNQETNDRIRRAIVEASDLIRPKATYSLYSVPGMIPGKEVTLNNGLNLNIPDCGADPGARLVAVAIGTLGNKMEKQCRRLADQGKIYESTLLDAVGTAMLDLLGEKICKMIEQNGNRFGLVKGLRFAPGLDGYPLEEQRLLFRIADNEAVGVFLNSSAVMMPAKSISFFLMLTKTLLKNAGTNKCSSCRMAGCRFRMVQKNKNLS